MVMTPSLPFKLLLLAGVFDWLKIDFENGH